MDSLTYSDELSTETSYGLHVCDLGRGRTHVETEECYTAEVTMRGIPSVPSVHDVLTDKEVDDISALIRPADLQGQLPNIDTASGEKVGLEPKKTENYHEFCLSAPQETRKQKAPIKSSTFPSSVAMDVIDLSGVGVCTAGSTDFGERASFVSTNPTYARSISLPASPELISALKGSRAQNGLPSNRKLHVKWAPEVYDPPCTIISHTVKKHYIQRYKAKKKHDNRNKLKSKSTRGNNPQSRFSDKIGTTSCMTTTVDMRFQTTRNSLLQCGYCKSRLHVEEYAVANTDSKCGSSFLREAIAKVNISIAKAT